LCGNTSGALAASAVFLYSFPLLRELFERGSPEGFAFALYPWVLWGLVRLIQQPNGWRLGLAVLSWATVILTHNLSALFLIPMFGLIALLFGYRRGWWALWAPILTLGLGFLLSAFFIIPFVAEQNSVQMANAMELDYLRVAQNPVSIRDFLQLPPPYDLGLDNNLISDHLGPLNGLVIIIALFAGPVLWTKRRRWETLVITVLALFGLVVVWLQTASANLLWATIPILAYVQMRTRLLGVVIVSIAIISGFLTGILSERWRTPLSYMLIAASILLALPVLYPQLQYRYAVFEQSPTARDAAIFSLQENVPGLTAFNEFLPVWRDLPFTADEAQRVARSLVANLPDNSRVIHEERGAESATVQIESPVQFTAALHMLYFPGWAGYVDGQMRSLKPMEGTGYILVGDIPAGTHTITLRYEGTPIQFVSSLISAVTAVTLFLIAILWRNKKSSAMDITYLKPYWWLAVGVVFLLGIKTLWLDPQTTLLRRTSDCSAIQGDGISVQVRLGESLYLCGIDLPDRVFHPGGTVRLTLYWETTAAIREPAETFVHLFGTTFNSKTNNALWGQQDKQLPGYHPVTRWTAGKLYRDSYEFRIASDAPPGEYKLEIGWWQPSNGLRLKPDMGYSTEQLSISPINSLFVSDVVIR
jgi:hypothetical protein